MKKQYLVTVDEDRYIWQRIDDCLNTTVKRPSLFEVIKKFPKIFRNMEVDRRHAIYVVSLYTFIFAVFSAGKTKEITIIVGFVAFLLSLLLGPFARFTDKINAKLIVFLIIYPVSMLIYFSCYTYISQIEILNKDNVGNTLTAISLVITIFCELYKILADLSLLV